ncbi:50S ribosomal protein L32 [Synechococcus sp. WH 7805]|nr:50S ribosomal protein L32 [Synechococcus sp. WH 7805]
MGALESGSCLFGSDQPEMAVPKKKTSKSKRNQRHAVWKAKAATAAQRALSIGKSVLSGRAQGFVYPVAETDDSES